MKIKDVELRLDQTSEARIDNAGEMPRCGQTEVQIFVFLLDFCLPSALHCLGQVFHGWDHSWSSGSLFFGIAVLFLFITL